MLKNSFRYSVDYDYQSDYSCSESGCDSDGICRCGVIAEKWVNSVDVMSITDEIFNQIMDPKTISGKRRSKLNAILNVSVEVDRYCIHRILTHHRVWDNQFWEIEVEGGYYGQEIGEVTMCSSVLQKVSDDCDVMISLDTNADKIRFVLELEYGYILPNLQNADFELIDVSLSYFDFKRTNQDHYENVSSKHMEYYSKSKYSLPRGIVKESQGLYTVVDGFHRIISCKTGTFKVFKIK